MTDKLRPDELEAFKAAFDMFDKNQDGTISTKVSKREVGRRGEERTMRDWKKSPGESDPLPPFYLSPSI